MTFPAETRIRMGLEVGVKLVQRNLRLERQMELAREVLREQADALQELARR